MKILSDKIYNSWSTDLSTISNSHVSVCGKLGVEDLYVVMLFQTAAASFIGTKSRNVVIVVPSSSLAAIYRTKGNSFHRKLYEIIN